MAITLPYTFSNSTIADALEVNANFAALVAKILDKTGDTMTGTLVAPALTVTGALGGNTATFSGTVGVTGVATFTAAPIFSAGTASQTVELDGSKALTTVATTGTGNYVKSASPTFTGTVQVAALTASGAITGALTGNASTATKLATARAINGVNFDGSAPITVTADASTLSGTTLKSTVVTSSLTAVGTITTGVWNAGAITSSGSVIAGGPVSVKGGGMNNTLGDSIYFNNTSYPTTYTNKITNSHSQNAGWSVMTFNLSTGASTTSEVLRLVGSGAVTTAGGLTVNGGIVSVVDLSPHAAGVGGMIDLSGKWYNSGETTIDFATIKVSKTTATEYDAGASLIFSLRRTSDNALVERMRIAQDGAVTISALASGNLTSASGVITSSSDEALKDIAGPLTYGLAEVLQIRPIRYHWNALSGIPSAPEHGGFGAQQVEGVMPLAVSYGTNGYRGLDTNIILAATVVATQELDARMRAIESKLAMAVEHKPIASQEQIRKAVKARKDEDAAVEHMRSIERERVEAERRKAEADKAKTDARRIAQLEA